MKEINIFFFVVFFVFELCINAQCSFNINIKEKFNKTSIIVEGEITKKEAFWLDNKIYTKNYLSILSSNNDETPKKIILLTKGGKIDDKLAIVHPSLVLNQNDRGIFLIDVYLEEKDWYCPSVGSQSFVSYEEFYSLDKAPKGFELSGDVSNYKAASMITINDISPKEIEAGNDQVLKIYGSGFGDDFIAPAKVQFRNPNYFEPTINYQTVDPVHILFWSDSEIHVRVPGRDYATGKAGAGSGEVRVVSSAGEIVQSTQEVHVLFNRVRHDNIPVDLINDNEFGGYTFNFCSNFSENNEAIDAIKRAIEKWTCAAQTNLLVDKFTAVNASCAVLDDVNIIAFDTECPLPFGTLAETTNWFTYCSDGTTYLDEVDIVFANAVNWNFSQQNPGPFEKDFESIALHEFGHVHGVEHVLEKNLLMYPSLADGKGKRNIDESSRKCGALNVTDSIDPINCGSASSFIPNIDNCQAQLDLRAYLQGAYIGEGWMRTNLVGNGILPPKQPYNNQPYNYGGVEENSNFFSYVVDWVLVEMRIGNLNTAAPSGTYVCERQAALLLADGKIVSADGFSPLIFNNLTPSESYYICLRHRNHLDIISSQKIPFSSEMSYDFTQNVNSASGDEQLYLHEDGTPMLYAGDINFDGLIQQTDIDIWKLNPAENNSYKPEDCTLDGIIQISDFDQWYYNRSKLGVFEVRY